MPDATSGDKYSIEGMLTLHELHPETREIIVEGRVDAGIIGWFAAKAGINVDVFDVDDRLDVPSECVMTAGQEVGKRGRVVAVAAACEPAVDLNVLCIADADFDHFARVDHRLKYLRTTDYAALELHVANEACLIRFRDLFLRLRPRPDMAQLLRDLLPALVELFLVRYVLARDSDPPGMIEKVESCIVVTSKDVKLDARVLIRKCISRHGRPERDVERLYSEVVELKRKIGPELLKYVNWHDFARCLIKVLKLSNDLAKPDIIERALVTCLNEEDVREFPLFQEIVARFSS